MKDVKHIRPDFLFGPLGHAGGFEGAGGQKLNFLNMVMWHIKLKGMSSRPGYTENFYPTIKLVTFGWVKGSNIIRFLSERGDLLWRAMECVLVLIWD